MRRHLVAEPFARTATWTRRLSLLGAGLAIGTILLAHRAVVSPVQSLALMGGALALSLLAVASGLIGAAVIWQTGHRGTGRILAGLALAAVTLAYPVKVLAQSLRLPPLADLSTDPADPPHFAQSRKASAARREGGELSWRLGPLQTGHPPADLEPVVLDMGAGAVFAAVLADAATLRWRVIEATAPGGRSGLGHIDAITYSTVLHLPQDIAIRIRPLAGQTRVDIRSASRLGVPDYNGNHGNISMLSDALQAQDDEK